MQVTKIADKTLVRPRHICKQKFGSTIPQVSSSPSEFSAGATPPQAPPRLTWGRVAWLIFLALAIVPIAYLLTANAWLATSARSLAHKKPEKFQADWSFAYTLWPGRVHFFDLELRGRNRSTVWYVSLDRGSGSIAIEDLFGRVARIEELRGSGLRFKVRPRVDKPLPEDIDPADVPPPPELVDPETEAERGLPPLLPPIPGFEGLGEPIKGTKPPWTIEIEHLDVDDVEEVWLERYHYLAKSSGSGRLIGAMKLRLRRSFELPHFELVLGEGQLEIRDRQLATLEKGRAVGALLPFPTRRYRVFELMKFFKTEVELKALDSDLSALEYYLRGSPIELNGKGTIEADLVLDQGLLGKSSRLAVTDAELELAYLAYWGRGKGRATVDVVGEPGPSGEEIHLARLGAKLDDFELGVLGSQAAHLRGKGLTVDASTANLDLSAERPQLRGTIRMPRTEIPDFRVYNSLWPPSFPFELQSGKAQLESVLHFDTTPESHRVDGTVAITGHGIRAALLTNPFVSDFRLDVALRSEDIKGQTFDIAGSRLEIGPLDGEWKPATRAWLAKVAIGKGTLRLAAPRAFDVDLEADLLDSSPLVAALITKKPKFDWMSGLLTVRNLHLVTHATLHDKNLALRRFKLEGAGDVAVEGELLLADKKGDGAFHIQYGPLSTAVRLDPAGGRDWKIVRPRHAFELWLDELKKRP